MLSASNCLETKNHEQVRVIFTEAQRQLKIPRHPELRDKKFITSRLKRTIENPDFIYQDFEKPKRRMVVYKEEYRFDGRVRYTKVVLERKKSYYFVITAFRPDFVKERGKTKRIYGKDN